MNGLPCVVVLKYIHKLSKKSSIQKVYANSPPLGCELISNKYGKNSMRLQSYEKHYGFFLGVSWITGARGI